jgi:hypothetical protein
MSQRMQVDIVKPIEHRGADNLINKQHTIRFGYSLFGYTEATHHQQRKQESQWAAECRDDIGHKGHDCLFGELS